MTPDWPHNEEDLRALVVETGSWFKLEKVGVKPYLMIDKEQTS